MASCRETHAFCPLWKQLGIFQMMNGVAQGASFPQRSSIQISKHRTASYNSMNSNHERWKPTEVASKSCGSNLGAGKCILELSNAVSQRAGERPQEYGPRDQASMPPPPGGDRPVQPQKLLSRGNVSLTALRDQFIMWIIPGQHNVSAGPLHLHYFQTTAAAERDTDLFQSKHR